MKKDIIEIRSNINATIDWLAAVEKEREEREKAEREARWKKEQEEREARAANWAKEHPILEKYTYISHYNYEYYSYKGEACDIYFYEWSNVEAQPLHFDFMVPFYRFLDSSKINLCDGENNKIKSTSKAFITCKPGCRDMIIASNYDELRCELQKVKSVVTVLAAVPEI